MQAPPRISGSERTAGWEVDTSGETAVVRLSGEIDLGVTDALLEHVTAALRESTDRLPDVHIDLEKVGFLDSSGLHFLVRVKEGVEERGGRFSVGSVHGSVQRLFEIVGARDLFEVVDWP